MYVLCTMNINCAQCIYCAAQWTCTMCTMYVGAVHNEHELCTMYVLCTMNINCAQCLNTVHNEHELCKMSMSCAQCMHTVHNEHVLFTMYAYCAQWAWAVHNGFLRMTHRDDMTTFLCRPPSLWRTGQIPFLLDSIPRSVTLQFHGRLILLKGQSYEIFYSSFSPNIFSWCI